MRDLKKKLIALFVVTSMILSVVSCRNKTAEESSQTEETTAVTTAVREETPAETTVTELVEPDYPVLAADENSITFNDERGNQFKIVKHKGKLYYCLIINKYLPKVSLYDTFGKFCQMVNIKNVKPIFNETDKRYI